MPQKKMSVYAKIASELASKIKDGIYKEGTVLPAERALMEAYGVERTTIRRALEVLCQNGFIEKRAGVGSIVISADEKTDAEKSAKKAQKMPVIRETVKDAPKEKQQILFIAPDEEIYSQFSKQTLVGKTLAAFEKYVKGLNFDFCPVCAKDIDELDSAAAMMPVYGAVIVGIPDENITSHLEEKHIPTVLCFGKSAQYRSVNIDNIGGMSALVSELISNGHKNICFIGSDEKYETERERRISFVRALEENGVEVNQELICTGGHDEKSGYSRFCEIYRRTRTRFTAVCAVNDEAALGAIKAAKEYHLRVPEDISVTGFASIDEKGSTTSAYVSPEILAQEIYFSLMCERQSGKHTGAETTLPVKITGDTIYNIGGNEKNSKRSMSDFLL